MIELSLWNSCDANNLTLFIILIYTFIYLHRRHLSNQSYICVTSVHKCTITSFFTILDSIVCRSNECFKFVKDRLVTYHLSSYICVRIYSKVFLNLLDKELSHETAVLYFHLETRCYTQVTTNFVDETDTRESFTENSLRFWYSLVWILISRRVLQSSKQISILRFLVTAPERWQCLPGNYARQFAWTCYPASSLSCSNSV